MNRRHISFPAVSIALLAVIATLASCKQKTGRKQVEKQPVAVGVQTVSKVAVDVVSTYVGEVVASRTAIISAPGNGVVSAMNAGVGSSFEKGAILAEIESENIRNTHEIAMANLRQAEDGYERMQKVHQSGTVPPVKMVEMETNLAKARALAASSEASLEACRIKAPFRGTVCDILAEVGENVAPGSPLMKIADVSSLEISIHVPETEIGKITTGMKAEIEIPAIGRSGLSAKVSSKGVMATALSHTYPCILSIIGDNSGLMSGMVCRVRIIRDRSFESIIVPSDAIGTDMQGRFVWTVEDGRAVKKTVTTGGYIADGVTITAGLEEGAVLIVRGGDRVSTGMKVRTEEVR